jgi:polyisoprenoid-binding protein YceI
MIHTLCALTLSCGALGTLQAAQAASKAKYSVEKSDESRVQFVSDAPLEKITGVGRAMAGDLELDPAAIDQAKGTIELDVNSINTNVDLRDEHLRGPDWLDAKKYPKIKFQISKVEGQKALVPGKAVEVTVKGKLSMHGVTRDETAKATVRYSADGKVTVKASFKVNLTHYKISVPQVVRLKVSDEIALNVMLIVNPKQ